MIKAVLFDLDGTLINTNKLILESFKYTFRTQLNMEMEDDKIVRFFGEPLRKSLSSVDPDNVDKLADAFHQFNSENHDLLAEQYEGTIETLQALKERGIKLAVVTSKRKVMTERSLKLIKIYDIMDVIITPEDTDKHKPDGEPALLACERLGVAPEEALMVGDSIYDVKCGKNAGSKTCIVTYSCFSMEDLLKENPDYVIDKLWQLVDIIEGKNIEKIS
ncbi:Pyrophosphatase PpaX [Clostridium sp. N3C]|uniref:pyrophosphatase PpaX n=1 Tax=Clostridium sp. N3C TaxID=1776758 RepID=UPI00092E199F|nr:pyrophosphatase PpaX [Clostridium sp. N3C]SCN25188.1 Pyrophosphatase PpaX [Clostridium sp. N3C]